MKYAEILYVFILLFIEKASYLFIRRFSLGGPNHGKRTIMGEGYTQNFLHSSDVFSSRDFDSGSDRIPTTC